MNRLQTSLAIVGIIGILSGQPAAISAQSTQLLIAQQSEKTYVDRGIKKYEQGDYKEQLQTLQQQLDSTPILISPTNIVVMLEMITEIQLVRSPIISKR